MNKEQWQMVEDDVDHIEQMRMTGVDTARFNSDKYLDKMLHQRIDETLADERAKQMAAQRLYWILFWWEKTKASFKKTVRQYFRPVITLWAEFRSLYTWAKGRIKHENAKSLLGYRPGNRPRSRDE